MVIFTVLILSVAPVRSYAFFSDGSGWAMFPYIVKMVVEAYKRYAQLQMLIAQGQLGLEYQKVVNSGIDNIASLIRMMPIQDERILGNLNDFRKAIGTVGELYGAIPQSGEAAMQSLHDRTIAESLKITTSATEYASGQEANAVQAAQMAGLMSPKGAARLSASTQAQILHTLSQLLKVNGQLLKIQSEQFALENKESKDSVGHFNKINRDVERSLGHFSGNFSLPRF